MMKNGMRPVHPGEILREGFVVPFGLTVHALAMALRVPAMRVHDIASGTSRHHVGHCTVTGAVLRRRRPFLDGFAGRVDLGKTEMESTIEQAVIPREAA